MAPANLVLLVPDDQLNGLRTLSSLQGFGYDVLIAADPSQALGFLEANRRIGVLVVDADLPEGRGLGLAKSARAINPKLAVIYTSGLPHRLRDSDKVSGAPCLRSPYHPHLLVGLMGQLTGRRSTDDEARVA
jgi:CheY-like chemotaxis protein